MSQTSLEIIKLLNQMFRMKEMIIFCIIDFQKKIRKREGQFTWISWKGPRKKDMR